MIYKRGKWYWMDATVNGIRYRLPLDTTNWQEASGLEKDKISDIKSGKLGGRGVSSRQAFNEAADTYIERRRLFSAPKTYVTDRERSQALRAFFGNLQIRRITSDMIAEYQAKRLGDGISGRTINLEVGLLRRIMKRAKQWARIGDDIEMLDETPKEPMILSAEEKMRLLATAQERPEWQVARCAAVLAVNTTMRGCELRGLRWRDVDLFEKFLVIRRQSTKTDAGARVIPLNRDAVIALGELWQRAESLGSNKPEHFVFPAFDRIQEMGKRVIRMNPDKPMASWRTAWRTLTKAAGLRGLRFHDLRHQAITELAETGLSDQTIMSIAGHVSREMLEHYSHIRMQAKRRAVEALETAPRQPTESPAPEAPVTVN